MKSYHVNTGAGLAGLTVREHDEPIEDAKAAYRYYEDVQPFGKVIISHS